MAEQPRKRTWLRRLGVALIVPVAALCVFVAYLETPWGKRQAASLLSDVLTRALKMDVRIEGIRGFLPVDIHVAHLALSDAQGAWLSIEQAHVRFAPGALLEGRVHLRDIEADAIVFDHLPPSKPKPEPEPREWALPEIPSFLSRISVEHLEITRFSLGQAIIGTPADFSIQGHLRATPGKDGLDLALHLARTDQPTTRLDLDAALSESGLAISAQAEDAALLTGLLGLDQPVRLDIEGAGPRADWAGVLTCDVAEERLVEGRLRLDVSKGVALSADLRGWPPLELVPEQFAAAIPNELRAVFALRYEPPGVLTVEPSRISMDKANLALDGRLDTESSQIRLASTLDVEDMALLAPLTKIDIGGSATARLEFDADANQGRLALNLDAAEVALAGGRVPKGEVHIEASTGGWPDALLEDLRVQGSGLVAGLAFGPLVEEEVRLALEAEAATLDSIQVSKLEVTDGNTTLGVHGQIAPQALRATLDATLTVAELHQISGVYGQDFSGGAEFTAHLETDADAPSLTAKLDGRLIEPGGLPAPVPALLGSQVLVSALLALDATTANVEGLDVRAGHAQVTANGTFDLTGKRLTAMAQLAAPDLGVVDEPVPLAGGLDIFVEVSGPLDSLKLEGAVEGTQLAIAQFTTPAAKLSVVAEGLPSAPRGHLDLSIIEQGQAVEADSDFGLEWPVLDVGHVSVRAGDNTLDGQGRVDLAALRGQGDIEAHLNDLALFGRMLDEPLAGRVHVRASLGAKDGQDHLAAALDAQQIQTRFGSIGSAVIEAHVADPFTKPAFTLDLGLESLDASAVQIASLKADAEGDLAEARVAIETEGTIENVTPFKAALAAALSPSETAFTLEQLDGNVGDFPFGVTKAATLKASSDGFVLSPLDVTLADGTARIEGVYGEDLVDARGAWRDLPLALAELAGAPAIEGTASGDLTVAGPPVAPACRASLRLDGVRIPAASASALPPMHLEQDATLVDGQLATSVSVEVPALATAKAALSLPVGLSVSPWKLIVAEQAALDGQLDGNVDLGAIPKLLEVTEHVVEGRFDARFDVGGTLSAPAIQGEAVVEKGRYENTETGTILSDLEVSVRAENDVIELARCQAGDGADGRIQAEGRVHIQPDKGFPFDAKASFDKARLVNRDDLSGQVDGTLTASGSIEEAWLGGAVTVGPATISMPEHVPPELADLHATEAGGATESGPAPPVKESSAPILHLDLGCDIPGRVFVRGPGLDSEWKGALTIKGVATRPEISGELALVRGHLAFLGRRFNLKKSSIILDGSYPPSPYLNFLAVTQDRDLTTRLQIVGVLSDLELNLNSEPPLPRDEIISRLLFNKNLTQISPVQAVQLARVAAMLTSRSGGLGFLGRPSLVPGVDSLDIRQSADKPSEATVGIGKYLSDDIRVELEQGTAKDSSKVRVEVQLFPNITLESEVGANARSGLGLFWKKDY